MDLTYFCTLFALGIGLRWLLQRLYMRWFYDLHRIPCPKGELPFVGHLLALPKEKKPNISKYFLDNTLEHGKIWRFRIFRKEHVTVTDREFYMTNIYGAGDKAEPKGSTYRAFQKLFGAHDVPNTFTSGAADAKYKAFRKTFAVAFSSDNLKKKFPALVKKAYEVADVVSENIENAIDYQELGVKFSFDSIGIFAYDLEFDSVKEGHPLLTSLEHCTLECTLDSINPLRRAAKKYLPFLDFAKKSKSEFNSLYLEYEKIFDHVNLYGDAPGEEDKSIRACLMRLRNPLRNDDKATPDELMSELSLFVFAGTDTTGHQIAWAMMWISENKEVQHKVYNELKAQGLAGAGARKVEYSDLAKLTYLKMLIMEIMRLTPAAQGRLARKIRQDMNVMGYRLPKGTMVGGSVLAQNRAPWLWKDPEVFKPERWEKGDEEVGTGQSKVRGGGKELWSFGVGVRDCVGQRLAMMELQMVIAILLSRFTFELDPRMGGLDGALKQSYNAVVQVCDGGMWVRAKRRLDSTPVVS